MIKFVKTHRSEKPELCYLCKKYIGDEKTEDGHWVCATCICDIEMNAIDGNLDIYCQCPICCKYKVIKVDRAEFNNWVSGMNPKEAFANTSKEDLSWIIYHTCIECWARCNMLTKMNSTEDGVKPL